jgi:hypothetical protein
MNNLAIRQNADQIERRRTIRVMVEIPVGFKTVSGVRECNVANISDNGARLEMLDPPAEGVSGWLILHDAEIYCRVIWADQRGCGVEFERNLGDYTLRQIASGQERDGPIVNKGRIQAGRKRSGLVSSD